LEKQPVPLHKSICDPILPGITAETSTWPQPPTNLMNNAAKPGYDETKIAQHFHQLGGEFYIGKTTNHGLRKQSISINIPRPRFISPLFPTVGYNVIPHK
jgi:hypothetical protein